MARFCKNCGNELALDEIFCTKCGTRNDIANVQTAGSAPIQQNNVEKKSSKKKKIMIAIGIIIVFFIGLMALGGNDKSAISVKADDMLTEFINDPGAAEKKYKGKRVSISGKIGNEGATIQFGTKIGEIGFGYTLAEKVVGDKTYTVSVHIPDSKEEKKFDKKKIDKIGDKLAALKPGDTVTIEGICVGAGIVDARELGPQTTFYNVVIKLDDVK